MGLFNIPEIEYFHEVKDNTYRRGVPGDAVMGNTLSDGVWEKTKQWVNAVQENTNVFTISFKKVWHKPGWDSGRVTQIKPYTWSRIFKPEDAKKGIYFTIGVDASRQSLLIKIHYQEQAREQELLTPAQRQLCERLIKSADGAFLYCREIPLQEVEEYSLEQLTDETIAFMHRHESTYDLIIALVWPTLPLNNEIRRQPTPIKFEPGPGPRSVVTAENEYTRSERTIQPSLVHLQISLSLYDLLVSKYGSQNVRREWPTANNTIVDMVRRENEELIFYEIKTYPLLKYCIREAVGQLIEYSCWPTGQLAKKLIIVTALPADAETNAYMKNMRLALNLPIYYQQFDLSRNVLLEEPDDNTE
ncbi:MAG: hypothetical protein H7319_15895 [Spirosoma sp.]|nr:hypothetical protein [Spirosoma sp.]